MKKILTIFLAASLLLVACGKDKEEKKETTKQEATATDEHGQKVEQAAEQNGYTPQTWTDKMTPNFKNMWRLQK